MKIMIMIIINTIIKYVKYSIINDFFLTKLKHYLLF